MNKSKKQFQLEDTYAPFTRRQLWEYSVTVFLGGVFFGLFIAMIIFAIFR